MSVFDNIGLMTYFIVLMINQLRYFMTATFHKIFDKEIR